MYSSLHTYVGEFQWDRNDRNGFPLQDKQQRITIVIHSIIHTCSPASSNSILWAFSTSSLGPCSLILSFPESEGGKVILTPPHSSITLRTSLPLGPIMALWSRQGTATVSSTTDACRKYMQQTMKAPVEQMTRCRYKINVQCSHTR